MSVKLLMLQFTLACRSWLIALRKSFRVVIPDLQANFQVFSELIQLPLFLFFLA